MESGEIAHVPSVHFCVPFFEGGKRETLGSNNLNREYSCFHRREPIPDIADS